MSIIRLRYRKESINHSYIVESTWELSSFMFRIDPGCMSVLISFKSSILYFLSKSLMYIVWRMYVLSFSWRIFIPRNNFNSPITVIPNSCCIRLDNFLHKDSLVPPTIISSTYNWTKIKSFLDFLLRRVLSTCPLVNRFHKKRTYRTKLYDLALNHIKLFLFEKKVWWRSLFKTKWLLHTTSSVKQFRKELVTSIWLSLMECW